VARYTYKVLVAYETTHTTHTHNVAYTLLSKTPHAADTCSGSINNEIVPLKNQPLLCDKERLVEYSVIWCLLQACMAVWAKAHSALLLNTCMCTCTHTHYATVYATYYYYYGTILRFSLPCI